MVLPKPKRIELEEDVSRNELDRKLDDNVEINGCGEKEQARPAVCVGKRLLGAETGRDPTLGCGTMEMKS